MNRSEAVVILELGQDYDFEEIRRNYISLFLETYRDKIQAVTLTETNEHRLAMRTLNEAFCILTDAAFDGDKRFLHLFETGEIVRDQHAKSGSLEEIAGKLIHSGEVGLALRLLEIGIVQSIQGMILPESIDAVHSVRLYGQALLKCGLYMQGMPFASLDMRHFEKAEVYARMGDLKSALQELAYELSLRESNITIDEICQQIAIYYFLLGDYSNAVNIIEEVLPKLMLKKEIFEEQCRSKEFALAMLLCIERLTGMKYNKIESLKLRIKYPLCFRYFQNCFGSVQNAFQMVADFDADNNKYENFLKSVQPVTYVGDPLNFHYDTEELLAIYYQIFKEPMQKSLIFHPK